MFDQFEELVTLFEGSPAGRELQAQICDMLVELIRQPGRAVKLLLVFREDYLAQLSTLLARCPALPEHGERLLAPPIEALPTILRGPFERHPEAYPARITPELAAELQAEIELRSDGSRLNLSEIEIACLRLWRDPDPSALYASKRFDGLLADTLADVLESLTAAQRDAAVALLGRMVTASGTRNVVSEDDLLEDVLANDDVSNDEARDVLGRLESARIIRREARHRIYCYEIVSEFLVGSIVQRRIAREAARAEAERRKEAERQLHVARQRSRRQRWTIAALGLGVCCWSRSPSTPSSRSATRAGLCGASRPRTSVCSPSARSSRATLRSGCARRSPPPADCTTPASTRAVISVSGCC